MNLSKPVRIVLTIVGFVAIISAGYIFYTIITGSNNFDLNFGKDESNVAQEENTALVNVNETGEVRITDKFLDEADEITIDELKLKAPELAKNTSIQNVDDKAKLVSKLGNREPENQVVLIESNGNSTQSLIIRQTDTVTLMNTTSNDVPFVDQNKPTDEEFVTVMIPLNETHTIGFDIIGTYKYLLNDREFSVVVEKYESQ